MFDKSSYTKSDLDAAFKNNVRAHSVYSAVLVDKSLNVILPDLILHSIDAITFAQQQIDKETNILGRDVHGYSFYNNAKTWFSHLLDHNVYENSSSEEDSDGY